MTPAERERNDIRLALEVERRWAEVRAQMRAILQDLFRGHP